MIDTLPDWLTHPAVLVALAIAVRAGLAYQRELSWPEYRTLHLLKTALVPIVAARLPLPRRLVVKEGAGRDSPAFLRTADTDLRATARRLRQGDGTLHLLAAVKRRPDTHGQRTAGAHLLWRHGDGTQTEAFLFQNRDGSTDVYAHHEPSVTDPDGHLAGVGVEAGDPRGVVTAALDPND